MGGGVHQQRGSVARAGVRRPPDLLAEGIMQQATSAASSVGSSHPLIESDSVEGTAVYGIHGQRIGSIKRLVIEKVTGKVVYAVAAFGGFLGLGEEFYTIPWEKLTYDPALRGFRADINEEQIRDAPRSSLLNHPDWSDREGEAALHRHYGVPPYWGAGF
jgi:sporulation protein YlmC with PRC-barrel domain